MRDREDREFQAFMDGLQSGALTYDEVKRRYLELGDRIRQRYEREYTAVSVDVVQSGLSKFDANELDAQLTFDKYHNWIDGSLEAFGCRHPNFTWAGDGLLAIFEQPEAAVAFARSVIDELPHFNSRHNRLPRPVQVRIGIHTGAILPGDSPGLGKIASRTFDLAGHLQKSALPNQVRISETTYVLLKEGAGQFVATSAELPNPSAIFVYPAHTAAPGGRLSTPPGTAPTQGTGAPVASPSTSAVSHGRAHALPWVLAGSAVLGVVVAAAILWPRNASNTRPASPGGLQVIRPQAGGTPQPGNAAAPAAVPAPAAAPATPPAETRGESPTAPAAARAPSPWEPSRAAWRSPDADSGLPPRFDPAPPERKWLLAIGVGRYGDPALSAETGGGDAQYAAAALQRAAGIPAGNVRVLTDTQATLDGIKGAFQWLQRSASSGKDTVFVYLAGGAAMVPDRPDFRHQTGTGYAFLPQDASSKDLPNSAIYGHDIATWLAATRAQTLVVLADTAHAAALDLPSASDPGRQAGLLAATSAVQKPAGRGAQASHFAESLAAGVSGQADLNRDRRITLDEVRQFLAGEVARRSRGAQSPAAQAGFGGYLPEVQFAGG